MSEKTTEPGSLVVLLRALVMLVFLVGLPGVAVLKGSFPELADRLAERGRDVLASLTGEVARARGAQSMSEQDTRETAPAYSTSTTIQSTTSPAHTHLDVDNHAPSRLSHPPSGEMTASPSAPFPPGVATRDTDQLASRLAQAAPFDAAGEAHAMSGSGPEASSRQQAGPAEPLDPQRAEQLAGLLRELGATYYRLEKWGADQRLFRFQCKMSVGGNRHVNRHFEATDVDPNRAIQRVVDLVQQWRGAGAQ